MTTRWDAGLHAMSTGQRVAAPRASAAAKPAPLPVIARPPLHDWPRLIDDLLEVGYSRVEIAAALGVPYTTLQSWRKPPKPTSQRPDPKPARPDFPDGSALLELHRRTFANPPEGTP